MTTKESDEIRRADTARKRLRCLKCGRMFWTDRCHRICRDCSPANARTHDLPPLARLWGAPVHAGKHVLAALLATATTDEFVAE